MINTLQFIVIFLVLFNSEFSRSADLSNTTASLRSENRSENLILTSPAVFTNDSVGDGEVLNVTGLENSHDLNITNDGLLNKPNILTSSRIVGNISEISISGETSSESISNSTTMSTSNMVSTTTKITQVYFTEKPLKKPSLELPNIFNEDYEVKDITVVDNTGCFLGKRNREEGICFYKFSDKIEAVKSEDEIIKRNKICCLFQDYERCCENVFLRTHCNHHRHKLREDLRAARVYMYDIANVNCTKHCGLCGSAHTLSNLSLLIVAMSILIVIRQQKFQL